MRVGYMSQAFSLYGELTVAQNLWMHARLYHLPAESMAGADRRAGPALRPRAVCRRPARIAAAGRPPAAFARGGDHPRPGDADPRRADVRRRSGGARRILGVAHRPVAREAGHDLHLHPLHERGDALRPHLADARGRRAGMRHAVGASWPRAGGRPGGGIHRLHQPTPRARRRPAARPRKNRARSRRSHRQAAPVEHPASAGLLDLGRLLAYSRRETLEILRDPVRLAFAFVGSLVLMLAFGFGITTDVENIRFASLDLDQTPESRAYLAEFEGSPYVRAAATAVQPEGSRAAAAGQRRSRWRIEIPTEFGRNLRRDAGPEVSAVVDGANPFRAETIKQYGEGVNAALRRPTVRGRLVRRPVALPGPRHDPDALPLQPELREHLRDRAEHPADPPDPDSGHPHGGERRAGEGARLHHQLLRDAHHTPGVPGGQAAPLHRDRDDELRDPDAHGDRRVPGAPEGERPDPDALHRCCT